MTMTYPIAGIDIGKDTLDISLLHANGSFEAFSFANEKASRKKLARGLQAKGVRLVVLEATGGYELPVMAALAEEGIAFARVNSARVRAFAKSMGQLAKTDRLDARCLALYGERVRGKRTRMPSENESRLNALTLRRGQLVGMREKERNRAHRTGERDIAHSIERTIAFLSEEIDDIDAEVETLIASAPEMAERRDLIDSVPGIAANTANVLLAGLPRSAAWARASSGSSSASHPSTTTPPNAEANATSPADALTCARPSIWPRKQATATTRAQGPLPAHPRQGQIAQGRHHRLHRQDCSPSSTPSSGAKNPSTQSSQHPKQHGCYELRPCRSGASTSARWRCSSSSASQTVWSCCPASRSASCRSPSRCCSARVVDALALGQGAFPIIGLWAVLGLFGIIAGVIVAVMADRLAHRRRLAALGQAFEHAIILPISYHAEKGSGAVVRTILAGTDALFWNWLSFLREQFVALVGIIVLVPTAIYMNARMAMILAALAVVYVARQHATWRARPATTRPPSSATTTTSTAASATCSATSRSCRATRASPPRCRPCARSWRELLAAQYPVLTWWGLLTVLTRIAATITVVAIYAVGALLVAQGQITRRRDRGLRRLRRPADRQARPAVGLRRAHLPVRADARQLLRPARRHRRRA